jgi:hypothetical protein
VNEGSTPTLMAEYSQISNLPSAIKRSVEVASSAEVGWTAVMLNNTIETSGHTTVDGLLNLSLNVGLSNAAVAVVVRVRPLASTSDVDSNGWPKGFFEQIAGSMPELLRAPQGHFEERLSFE